MRFSAWHTTYTAFLAYSNLECSVKFQGQALTKQQHLTRVQMLLCFHFSKKKMLTNGPWQSADSIFSSRAREELYNTRGSWFLMWESLKKASLSLDLSGLRVHLTGVCQALERQWLGKFSPMSFIIADALGELHPTVYAKSQDRTAEHSVPIVFTSNTGVIQQEPHSLWPCAWPARPGARCGSEGLQTWLKALKPPSPTWIQSLHLLPHS